jgi:hypothetical protein
MALASEQVGTEDAPVIVETRQACRAVIYLTIQFILRHGNETTTQ